MAVVVGDEVDLLLTFGNQKRFKCKHCKKFMPVASGDVQCKSCGAHYTSVGNRHVVGYIPVVMGVPEAS